MLDARPIPEIGTPETRRDSTLSPSHCLLLAIAALTGALSGLSVALFFLTPLGHDQSWYIYAATRLLEGARPYGGELMETNPPFVIWFTAVSTAIARGLHLPIVGTFCALTTILAVALLAWSLRLFRLLSPSSGRLLPALFLLLSVWVTLVHRSSELPGQREYFTVLFSLPYLVLSALRLRKVRAGKAGAIAAGVAAALGVCFKPQQGFALLAVEGVLLFALHSMTLTRAELWSLLLTGVTYLAAVHICNPGYFAQTLPLVQKTYWAYSGPLLLYYREQRLRVAEILVCLALAVLLRRRLRTFPLILIFFAACAGSYAAYFEQSSGQSYRLFPALAFAGFAIGMTIADLTARRVSPEAQETRSTVLPIVAVALAFSVLAAGCVLANPRGIKRVMYKGQNRSDSTEYSAVLESCPPGTHVYVMETGMPDFYAIVTHKLVWSSRFAHLWMMPAILKTEAPHGEQFNKSLSPDTLRALEGTARADMVEDFQRWQPAVVVVNRCDDEKKPCFALDRLDRRTVNLLAWFSKNPEFAQLWSRYALAAHVGRYDLYTLRSAPVTSGLFH